MFEKALKYATKAHAGTTRKGSNEPYINHPIEVAQIAKTMTDDQNVWVAALLHDTVEDTSVTMSDIRKNFGDDVADLVASDTENKRGNLPAAKTWKIRKQETINHLKRTTDLNEKILVLSDKLSNIRQLAQEYKKRHDQVWQLFNQKNKEEHEWYYRSILEATKELSKYPAWQEYKQLVTEVFS